jgi:hypothetical protein
VHRFLTVVFFILHSFGHTLEVTGSFILIFGGITAAGQSDELWQVRMLFIVPMLTSRGCPFSCFSLSSSAIRRLSDSQHFVAL